MRGYCNQTGELHYLFVCIVFMCFSKCNLWQVRNNRLNVFHGSPNNDALLPEVLKNLIFAASALGVILVQNVYLQRWPFGGQCSKKEGEIYDRG